jgi:hypothetical protein
MGDGTQIAVVRPRNFRDGATIGEYFRQEIPVIINLEDMDNAEAERIIDFASGLILGLCGDIERLSRRTFLIVPAGATILTTHNALTEEGFFNQALPWISGLLLAMTYLTRLTSTCLTESRCLASHSTTATSGPRASAILMSSGWNRGASSKQLTAMTKGVPFRSK